jgi:ribosome-associated translation inhibitor RaiA
MRVEFIANEFPVSDVLRTYAESRVWLAVRRAAAHLSWVGVRLISDSRERSDGRVGCRIDVWLRGRGVVTVAHTDVDPYVAIDCASVRLEQALVRKLREIGRHVRGTGVPSRAGRQAGATCPRYAMVLVPPEARPRLSAIPLLRARYGIEQVQTVSLRGCEWDALVERELSSPHLKRLKDRLALAHLCRPEAVVLLGAAPASQPSRDEPRTRREMQQVMNSLRYFGLGVDVIGVWVDERWTPDDCMVESQEVPLEKGSDDGGNWRRAARAERGVQHAA